MFLSLSFFLSLNGSSHSISLVVLEIAQQTRLSSNSPLSGVSALVKGMHYHAQLLYLLTEGFHLFQYFVVYPDCQHYSSYTMEPLSSKVRMLEHKHC